MKKLPLWSYYLLAWAGYGVYIWIDNIMKGRGATPYVWSNFVVSFAQFSFCFFVVYPSFRGRRQLPLLIAGLLAALALWIGLRCLIEEVLYVWLIGHHNYTADTSAWYYIRDNLWRALQPMLLSFIIWAFLDTFRRERETELLRREKVQAELAFLKSQINPHFLYNTLNYIYSLAYPVSDGLANAVIKLSGLMRYMLTSSSDHPVALQQELDYLQAYIDLYQLRFEQRCFIDFRVQGAIAEVQLPSLLLVPFVENAFKHGVMDDPEHPVRIQLEAGAAAIRLRVDNMVSHGQKDAASGIGMANVQRRLELLYPGRFTLAVNAQPTSYSTDLYIQLKP